MSTPLPKLDLSQCTVIKGSLDGVDVTKGLIVLEFWATWCPPCRNLIPHLTQVAKKYSNAHFIGITSEPAPRAIPFVTQMGDKMDYIVLADPSGAAADLYDTFDIQGIPHALIVSDGQVVFSGHPMEPGFEATLAQKSA